MSVSLCLGFDSSAAQFSWIDLKMPALSTQANNNKLDDENILYTLQQELYQYATSLATVHGVPANDYF